MKAKRLISLMMAITLAVTALSGLAVMVSADEVEYEYTDSYVITYAKADGIPDEYAKPYLYASPHEAKMKIRNIVENPGYGEQGELITWWTSQQVYNMINTTKLESGDYASALIEVYCTDACIDAVSGTAYQRINLEDSAYYSDATSGRLRAIFMSSFPYIKDMAVIQDAVNAWLKETKGEGGYTAVSGLTGAEAITATQYTIWCVANAGDTVGISPYVGTETYTAEDLAENVVRIKDSYVDCTESARETTSNNINMLHEYLMALEPAAAKKTVVSDDALTLGDLTIKANDDGTYTYSIPYQINVDLGSEDKLVLSAACGEEQTNVALTEANLTGTLSMTAASATDDVKVELNGSQVGGDVYFFDAIGEREAGQSMIGYDDSVLPVHAEATAAPRILELNKIGNVTTTTTDADGNATETTEQIPLQNIQFEIYFVCTMENYISGKVTFKNAPMISESELKEYVTAENLVATVTTDEDGYASYNFTVNDQPDGIYIVKELHNEYTKAPMDPFYLAVPYTDSEGNVSTTIEINPKNDVENEEVEIEKDVTDINIEHDTYDMGENHTWIIQSSIPKGMGDGLKYTVTDTLDYRLTLVSVDRVAVAKDNGTFGDSDADAYIKDPDETKALAEDLVLTVDEDYGVTIGTTTDEDGRTVDNFSVALTETGRKNVAAYLAENELDYGDYEVRVYFTAYINTNAELGVAIPNQAHIDYTNNLGMDFEADSDIPDVQTGGVEVNKTDVNGNVLAGAKFSIARAAAKGETADTTITVDGQKIAVVYVDFYATADKSGDKVYEVTTGENGVALFYGLAYSKKVGTYYIIETEAPAGYNELLAPVAVEVTAASHLDGAEYTIVNTTGFELPTTGGAGTTMFIVAGVVIIAAAMLLIFVPKKKNT